MEIKDDEKTIIINNWIKGDSISFISDVSLPQSLFGNNYSISFLVKLNDLTTNKETSQIIFRKGRKGNEDLELTILPFLYTLT